MRDAPKTIYLQVCEDDDCETSFADHDEVTWCDHQINNSDIEYVRVDAVPQEPACVCGDLTALGVVHRTDGPCYIPEKQEPCEYCKRGLKTMCLCRVPPQRQWVGLTDAEREELMENYDVASTDYARAIEVKLKEKNT